MPKLTYFSLLSFQKQFVENVKSSHAVCLHILNGFGLDRKRFSCSAVWRRYVKL